MTPRLTAETFSFAPAQTTASSWTACKGGRPSLSTPSSLHQAGVRRRRPQGTRPEQPSLASVGSGMAATLPPRTLQCVNLGDVRSFSTKSNVNVRMIHATRLAQVVYVFAACPCAPTARRCARGATRSPPSAVPAVRPRFAP